MCCHFFNSYHRRENRRECFVGGNELNFYYQESLKLIKTSNTFGLSGSQESKGLMQIDNIGLLSN